MSCEKADLHRSDPIANQIDQIVPRSDCEYCPDEDECCCAVWLYHDHDAQLEMCGTSDVTGSCSGSAICTIGSFSGGWQSFTLDDVTPTHPFCMVQGRAFWIQNTHPTDAVDNKISCQGDIVNPQILTIHLNHGDIFYYSIGGSCQILPCP